MSHANFPLESWNDLFSSSTSFGNGGTSPVTVTPTGGTRSKLNAFANAGFTDFMLGGEILHGWMEGSTIAFHVHLWPHTNSTGNIKLFWEHCFVIPNGIQVAAWSTLNQVVTIPANSSGKIINLEFADETMSGYLIGTQYYGCLYRNKGDGADTFPDAIGFTTDGYHIRNDTAGSKQRFVK